MVALAAVVGGAMLVVQLPQLVVALGSITASSPVLVPIGLLLAAIGVVARAVQTRATSHVCGIESAWRRDLELSATAYATNRVVKSGGLAGLVHHLADADRHHHSRRGVTLAYAVSKVSDVVAFAVVTALAVGIGAVTGVLSGAALIAGTITFGYAMVQVGALWLVVRHPRHLRRMIVWVRAVRDRVRRRPLSAERPDTVEELAVVVSLLRTNPGAAVPIVASACVAKLVGLAMLLLVVGGLGLAVDPISIGVIFVLGLAAAMLGPLPGGLGTTEASLAAMLGMVGVAASAAASVVVAFRLFDFWLPTVFGFAVSSVHFVSTHLCDARACGARCRRARARAQRHLIQSRT